MTKEELDHAMMRDIQLHESIEIHYIVIGWAVTYSPDDGNTELCFEADTPIKALELCFSQIRNQRGRV